MSSPVRLKGIFFSNALPPRAPRLADAKETRKPKKSARLEDRRSLRMRLARRACRTANSVHAHGRRYARWDARAPTARRRAALRRERPVRDGRALTWREPRRSGGRKRRLDRP